MRLPTLPVIVTTLCLTSPAAHAAKATFTAGGFLLSVDGGPAAAVASVESGNGVAELTVAPGAIADKRLTGQVIVQPMRIRYVPGSAAALEGWLADGLIPDTRRANGEILLLDSTGKASTRRTFANAGVQQLAIPALDAASREPLFLHATVKPLTTSYETDKTGTVPAASPKAKAVLTSGFRLTIDGLDTSGVERIDAITVTQTLSASGVPQSVDVSNVVVSLTARTSEAWFEWFEDMVKAGPSNELERTGKLELLSVDGQTRATLRLQGLGVISVGAERADGWVTKKGATKASGRVKVEMYCESVAYEPQA